MNNIKNITAVMLAMMMALSIAGCGQKGPLIVEPTEPLETEPLQEEAIDQTD
ncbi:MAG: lipoprotein [Pseudomonadota bacterium]